VAEAIYNRALQGFEKALGLEHKLTLNSVHNLRPFYTSHGRLDKAKVLSYAL